MSLKTSQTVGTFIHTVLASMQKQLVKVGSMPEVYYGTPADVFKNPGEDDIAQVFTNHDYEPLPSNAMTGYAILSVNSIAFNSFKTCDF